MDAKTLQEQKHKKIIGLKIAINMTEKQIQKSILKLRVEINSWDKLFDYLILGGILSLPMIILFYHIKVYFQGNPKPMKGVEIWLVLILSTLGNFFYWFKKKQRALISIEANLNHKQQNEFIQNVTKKLTWYPEIIIDKAIFGNRFLTTFGIMWMQQIIIIFDENRILINSMPYFSGIGLVELFLIKENKETINVLIEAINKAKQQ
jgi:hypothetical protein